MKAKNSSLQLLRYRKSNREEVFAFLRTIYSAIGSDRLIHQWNWKYDANPFNRNNEPYLLLLKADTKIVAMLGSVFLRVSVGGRECWVTHSCDLVVHPDYRGQGLSQRILGQYIADSTMGFGWLNELSHRIIAPLRTWGSARLTPLVKPVDFDQLLQEVTRNRLLGRWGSLLAPSARNLIRPLRRQPAPVGVTITQGTTFDQRFDTLWKRVYQDNPVIVVRDQSYLNWRFVCRPDAKYTLLMATRGSDLVGYLVLRKTEICGLKWGYLVDFLVENRSPSLLALLVEQAEKILRKEGVTIVSCLATAPFCRRSLYRQGFFPWHWGSQWYLHSRVDLSDPTLQVFRDARQWFLTMGDGDLEMVF